MATTTTVATDAQLLKAASALSKNKFAVQGTALANKTPQQIVDLVKATPSLGATLTLPAGVILPQPGKTAAQTVAQSQKPSAMSQMAAEQAAAKKATAAASTAQQTEQLKTARALGYDTLGEYNTAINSAKQAGFGTDINAYNAYVARTNAAINPAIKPAVPATTGADAIKPPTPAVPYTRPAVAAPVAPEPAKLTAAQQEEAARAAKMEEARQADILARQQRAEKEAADEAARAAKIEAAMVADLKTKPAFQSAIQKVIDSGQPLTQAAILAQRDSDVAAATTAAAEKAQADALITQKTDQYNSLSTRAKTQSELDDIVAKAKAEGVTINPGYLEVATQSVQRQEAQATADQLAQQQKTVDTGNFLNNLPQPGTAEFAQKANQGAIITGPSGTAFMPIPPNQVTGAAGKWLVSDNGGASFYNAGAKPDTAVSYNEANKQFSQTQTQNFELENRLAAEARAAQAEAARRANDFTWEDLRNIAGIVGVAALGVAAFNYLGSSALATEAASTAGGMAAEGASASEITSTLISGGVDAEAAASLANTATGITSGTIDAVALAESGGITAESLAAANATANPLATVGQTLTELNALETAELLKNIDPAMISSLAPTTSGTVGGTASSIFSGSSLNPITNVLTNIGVTNPIVSGALTGVGTGAVINTLTGQPITSDSLLLSALGGGVAGGIGAALPDFGGGTFGSALAGAATNVGATAVVSAVTGQPITLSNLATAALIGGTVGAGIQVATDGAGNTTYQYDDGSSMTVNSQGTPVAVTDSSGAQVPVAAVDSRTGQPKQLAPVEEAQPRTPEQIAAEATPPGPVAPPAQVDLNNITQEQLNQTLSENNPYLESKPIETVAVAPTETQTDTTPVADLGVVEIVDQRPPPVAPVYIPEYIPELINTQPVVETPLTPPTQVVIPPSEPIPEVQVPEQPVTEQPTQPIEPVYPPVYVPPIVPPLPTRPGYGPLGPTNWGTVEKLNLPGLNPGFITDVPRYYNNPSPVAAQYYYGPRAYQTGQTFDPVLYNTLPVAPPTPFGLQQMYDPQSQTIANLLRGVGQAAQVAPYNIPQAPRV